MSRPRKRLAVLAVACCTACSPALDWRTFEPEGSGIELSLPCRPDRHARVLTLGGERVAMQMVVCTAAETTFALAYLDISDPARAAAALRELRAAALANVQAGAPKTVAVQLRGMTPNDEAMRLAIDGHLPDGTVVHETAAFFAHGLRLYQATVIGARPGPQAVETFFAGLRFPG